MSRGKLLWIGDACCQSGFAKATHETLKVLSERWDVSVLGLNYRGGPHTYPYDIYPARMVDAFDGFGLKAIVELRRLIIPDVVVVQNDPWNFPAYLQKLKDLPVVGAIAVDGLNCRGTDLNGLKLGVFWTDFGVTQARAGGYSGPAAVVPLGVDLLTFRPLPKVQAREIIGVPRALHNAFIVGNVNRNQERKRFDLTIRYFAKWVKKYNVKDAYLFMHQAPTGEDCYDLPQLAAYYGIANRLIHVRTDVFNGVSETRLNQTYNCFDVQFSTSQGEGWGLPALEGMAAGIPLLAPDWSAYGDWARDAASLVECTSTAATVGEINVIGGIMDEKLAIEALQRLYADHSYRQQLSVDGQRLAHDLRYDWRNIGTRFADAMDEALEYAPIVQKHEVVGA
jgi:D-inositol-3-phosphate glycosyltransferase